MIPPVSLRARCERHAGEPHSARCEDCDAAQAELEHERARERHQRAIERNLALGIDPNRTPRRDRARR